MNTVDFENLQLRKILYEIRRTKKKLFPNENIQYRNIRIERISMRTLEQWKSFKKSRFFCPQGTKWIRYFLSIQGSVQLSSITRTRCPRMIRGRLSCLCEIRITVNGQPGSTEGYLYCR